MTDARPALVARAAWGTLLVTRPGTAVRLLGGRSAPPLDHAGIVRVLGVRHLAQAVLSARWDSPPLIAGAVDAAHAASALAFAVADRRWRRVAIADAAIASAFAATSLLPNRTRG